MHTAVGIFRTRAEAERAIAELERIGVPRQRVTLLAPGVRHAGSAAQTGEMERPGTGRALGGVVGTAVGAAAGMGAAVATFAIPGVGPVIALGLAGAALVGAGGAVVGETFERWLSEGALKDQAFVYIDALRQGRAIVVVLAIDGREVESARATLTACGAESVDAAREEWWLGLRGEERERYAAEGHDFEADEPTFRLGFEAARGPGDRRTYQEARTELAHRYPKVYDDPAFMAGYERGAAYERAARRDRDRQAA